jgi:DNA-binding transcriptional MerR regulator
MSMMATLANQGHMPASDGFVTVEEAARMAEVSTRTIRRWITAGDVRAEEGPEARRVSVSDVHRRAARSYVRSRRPPGSDQSEPDMDNGVVAVAVATTLISHLTPHLAEITDQVERLTREVMTEKIRAETAERERDQLQAELEQVSRELLAALTGVSDAEGSQHRDHSGHAAALNESERDRSFTTDDTEPDSWWRRALGLGPSSGPPRPRF